MGMSKAPVVTDDRRHLVVDALVARPVHLPPRVAFWIAARNEHKILWRHRHASGLLTAFHSGGGSLVDGAVWQAACSTGHTDGDADVRWNALTGGILLSGGALRHSAR